MSGKIPIGTIYPIILGYFTDSHNGGFVPTSVIPTPGWSICDGSAPNDLGSPIWNTSTRRIPNLTDNRFLAANLSADKGGSNSNHTSGLISGSISIDHDHIIEHSHPSISHQHDIIHQHSIPTHYHKWLSICNYQRLATHQIPKHYHGMGNVQLNVSAHSHSASTLMIHSHIQSVRVTDYGGASEYHELGGLNNETITPQITTTSGATGYARSRYQSHSHSDKVGLTIGPNTNGDIDINVDASSTCTANSTNTSSNSGVSGDSTIELASASSASIGTFSGLSQKMSISQQINGSEFLYISTTSENRPNYLSAIYVIKVK